MRYRRKPPEVEAMQWLPNNKKQKAKLCAWLTEHEVRFAVNMDSQIEAMMLDHAFLVDPEDWVVCGPHQEWFPVKPDVFTNLYEELL